MITLDREELDKAATFALATISASETPEWLRDMAFEQYSDIAWHLQFDYACDDGDRRELWMMAYYQVFEVETRHFLARLPSEVRAAHCGEVALAIEAAKSVDFLEMTMTARFECMDSLYRLLRRLQCYAEESGLPGGDAGTEPFDSMYSENADFLTYLGGATGSPDDDDDEISDDEEHLVRSNNHGFDY